jgi:site-specific DNA-methyltransferase (adenine-specific)
MGAGDYELFSRRWVDATLAAMAPVASFYVWLGADCRNGFHPFPEFCQIMRTHQDWTARNWITLRNQRGYGTQKNWMWVRQELLYYARGPAAFDVQADYTEIPKAVRGYYKTVSGARTENLERGRSPTIRAGNVWIDIQQVFYRREENVPGCYAQKPLKAIERIMLASSVPGDTILDPFCHSGTVLAAGEMLGRRVATGDIDPIFAEIAIRRLERLRATGKTGWQWQSPFPELNVGDGTACAR